MATLQLRPRDKVDEYTVLRQLGRGSTSIVYEVTDKSNVSYALKIFAPDHKLSNYTKDLFFMEYNATLGISHPNVLSNVDVGAYEDRPYLIMDICEDNLFSFIEQLTKSNDKVSEKYLALIINHICRGLIEINNKGLIHNDIKPANILIKTQPSLVFVLSDFGISAKFRKTMLKETMIAENIYSGITPNYAAPERFKGRASQKSDIFSLGVILYEIIYGNLPLEDTEFAPGQGLDNNKHFSFPKRNYSNRVVKILKACLALDLSERPSPKNLVKWTDSYIVNQYWPHEVDSLAEDKQPSTHWVENSRNKYKADKRYGAFPSSAGSSPNSSSPNDNAPDWSQRSAHVSSHASDNKYKNEAKSDRPRKRKSSIGFLAKLRQTKKPKYKKSKSVASGIKSRRPRIDKNSISKVMRLRRLIRNPRLLIMPFIMMIPAAYFFMPALRSSLRMSNKVNRFIPKTEKGNDIKIIECGSKYGMESGKGELIIPCVYDDLYDFRRVGKENSVGIFRVDDKCGFIDIRNQMTQTYTICKFEDDNTGYASWTNEYGTLRETRIILTDRFR